MGNLENRLAIYFFTFTIFKVAVAVKTLKEGSSFEEKIDFLSEAEMMKRSFIRLLIICHK